MPKARKTTSPSPSVDTESDLGEAGQDEDGDPRSTKQPNLSHLVELRLLDRVSPEPLLRFLKPHEAYLASRGVHLDGICVDEVWRKKLHTVLLRVDEQIPASLQQGLIDIANIANEEGHEHVLAARFRNQLDLFPRATVGNLVDAAFQLYLEHPPTFRSAVARAQAARAERFAEYYPRFWRGPLVINNARISRLREAVSKFNEKRNRTRFCDLEIVEGEDEVLFVIIHGRPPRTHSTIEDGKVRSRCTYVPDRFDTVIFHRQSGALSASAQFSPEQEFYRQTFGRIFFHTISHFEVREIFFGAPLLEMGPAALSCAGVPGLRLVQLRCLRVIQPQRQDYVFSLDGKDLMADLKDPITLELMRRGKIRVMGFALWFEGEKRELSVEVVAPNRLAYDRRKHKEQVRQFLLSRKFFVPPTIDGEAPFWEDS